MKLVIPSCNPVNLKNCVNSAREHGVASEDIIVVADGCGTPVYDVRYIEGKQPFYFARNVNLGLKQLAGDDALLVNEDVVFLSDPRKLIQSEYGILSPSITGQCGNKEQWPQGRTTIQTVEMVCFICVFISAETLKTVGLLDERYVGYGFDDDDYCRRARLLGVKLGVDDSVQVEHSGIPAYRRKRSYETMFWLNKGLFNKKWNL